MLILPVIDLLILMGSASLMFGFVIKVIDVSTRYHPSLLGFTSLDFVVVSGICFSLALTLVGRTWLKLNEPRLAEARRNAAASQARMRAAEMDLSVVSGTEDRAASTAGEEFPRATTAGADRL